jgi:hypothetical protein
MALSRGPKIVTNGLVVTLDAADKNSYKGSGTTWTDVSGNGNAGTLTNGPTFSTTGNGSISFNGLNNYIGISSPSNRFNWTPSGVGFNNMTLDLWIRTSDTSGYVLSKPWNANGEYNYYLYYNGFYINTGNQANAFNFSSISTGNWINITILVSTTQWGAYINGVQNVALTNHGITNNTPTYGDGGENLALMTLYPYGIWAGSTAFSISGNVGCYKMYNRVLTAVEILRNYNAVKTRFGL